MSWGLRIREDCPKQCAIPRRWLWLSQQRYYKIWWLTGGSVRAWSHEAEGIDWDFVTHWVNGLASQACRSPNGNPSGSRSSLACTSRSSSLPVMISPLSVMLKPRSTCLILRGPIAATLAIIGDRWPESGSSLSPDGLFTRTVSSTSLTWFPSVNVIDWMRRHGTVEPRLNFVPLRPTALSTSPIAIYVPCADVLQIPNSGCFSALQLTEAVLSVITPLQRRPVIVASNRLAGIVPWAGCEKDNVDSAL